MRHLSLIRRVDELGRIVIPVELRRMLGMESGQDVELIVKDEMLMLRRFQPGCVFCGRLEQLVIFEGKNICSSCRKRLTVDI